MTDIMMAKVKVTNRTKYSIVNENLNMDRPPIKLEAGEAGESFIVETK